MVFLVATASNIWAGTASPTPPQHCWCGPVREVSKRGKERGFLPVPPSLHPLCSLLKLSRAGIMVWRGQGLLSTGFPSPLHSCGTMPPRSTMPPARKPPGLAVRWMEVCTALTLSSFWGGGSFVNTKLFFPLVPCPSCRRGLPQPASTGREQKHLSGFELPPRFLGQPK